MARWQRVTDVWQGGGVLQTQGEGEHDRVNVWRKNEQEGMHVRERESVNEKQKEENKMNQHMPCI